MLYLQLCTYITHVHSLVSLNLGYNKITAGFLLLTSGIPNDEMVSRIESMVGHSNHDTQLYWGDIHGSAVEITSGCPDEGVDCKTLHVDLDLAADVNYLPDPEVDIDFDVEFECTEEGVLMATTNIDIDADSDWFWEVLSLGTINFLVAFKRGDLANCSSL